MRETPCEPVAILGIGCRFPGSADDPDLFWARLCDGGSLIESGSASLENVDQFDADFFGIPPREIATIDPQQRLLLMAAWEALENAAQIVDCSGTSTTGVFMGVSHSDYAELASGDPLHQAVGTDPAFAAGRISHYLGLRGPSISVSTTCSSSLVAVHLACEALRAGECDLALAGGANLVLTPSRSQAFERMGLLAGSGQCRVFDAAADGFIRGDGVGVIVLKRLADACADADPVRAVIIGSAVNHNGGMGSLSLPHGPSQQALLRRALESAGITASAVGYIEAHATGSLLGDAIEVNALRAVFAGPLCIGSLKGVFGHLEAASGIAGLIKTVLSIQFGELPGVAIETLNPHIDPTGLVIPKRTIPWKPGDHRIAGVTSLGMSGTNAHVIVSQWDPEPDLARPAELGGWVLPVSARSDESLAALTLDYCQLLEGASAADVCYTASRRRIHHEHRTAVCGRSSHELASRLALATRFRVGEVPRFVFVYSGEKSVWSGMGRELEAREPVFAAARERACSAIARAGGNSEVQSFAVFILQTALTALWTSWGIAPDAVCGYGLGEVVAAHAAGVLDLETAAAIVVSTNATGDKSEENGGMVVAHRRIQKILATVMPQPATAAMFSTVTGTVVEGSELNDDYWLRNLSEPALIQPAFESLASAGYRVFVDISPGPSLERQILQTFRLGGVEPVITPSLRRNRIEWETLFDSLCALYGIGAVVNWNAVNRTGRAISLPKYPWHTRSYWIDGADSLIRGLSKETRRVDEFRATFLGLTEGERIDRLKELVQTRVGEILGISFGEQLKVEAGFMQLGMDSRMLAELRVSLEAATSLPLPMSALFEYPTIQSLSGHLFSLAEASFEEMRYA